MAIHREIYILAGMEHPNIMKLYEVIDTKSHVHLVMELCQGKSLYTFVQKYGERTSISNEKTVFFLNERTAQKIFR